MNTWLAWTAKEFRLQVGLHSSDIEDVGHDTLWLSCWTRCAQGLCEVDSDCTHEKTSVRIDVTVRSTGTVVPPVTVGARCLFFLPRTCTSESDGAFEDLVTSIPVQLACLRPHRSALLDVSCH